MATAGLTSLPNELLDEIIKEVLPEDFDSLTLTCKSIYEACTPFLEQHKHLCSQFRRFGYMGRPTSPFIRTGFDLLTRIAAEPIVAHYIRDADFVYDSFPSREKPIQYLPNIDQGGPVVALFAESPYLKQAGLDWREYYRLIQDELSDDEPYYSQYLAAFILTLLPNAKILSLPKYWRNLERTDKLVDVIIQNARKPGSLSERPSLAKVTGFEPYYSSGPGHKVGLRRAIPFLALPHVRTLAAPSSVALGDFFQLVASEGQYLHFGENLVNVQLEGCWIDEVTIGDFLKHTPRLRTLLYSHVTKPGHEVPQTWDICKFITAIEREVGGHLEELFVSVRDLSARISPGKTSMRGFQRLKKLEFPVEVAVCNITDAIPDFSKSADNITDQELEKHGLLIGDFVPSSVSELSLLVKGTEDHKNALKLIFSNFAAKKESQLPDLKEICLWDAFLRNTTDWLSGPREEEAKAAHEEACAKITPEIEQAGVAFRFEKCSWGQSCLEEWPYSTPKNVRHLMGYKGYVREREQ
ncbi:F-box domain protein [Annulohypoxylon moriforme]|nr:F-box domain protein [Annulohypoxylon moriforme]